jgi:Mn2+/Fe2+ NRAMP family transporter
MAAVQFMCAKVGLVSSLGLAGGLRTHYSRGALYPAVAVLVVANTVNAGVDLGVIATGFNLLVLIPSAVLLGPSALAILALQLFGSYRLIARAFTGLTLSLLAYIGAAFLARPDWGAVLLRAPYAVSGVPIALGQLADPGSPLTHGRQRVGVTTTRPARNPAEQAFRFP